MPEFLPISRADMQRRGWEQCDFVYIIGDGYVDHPSFGHAIISRVLEDAGYKIGIISQPDWKKPDSINVLGEPRLGFLVMGGNMDSMVNHYTVSKAHRKQDAYTPGGVMGKRPDYAVTVYCNLIRRTYRRKPIIIGGIEASLRRLAHYDYWSDKLKRSILLDSQADLLIYGMGERAVIEIANALNDGMDAQDITYIDGTVYKTREPDTSVPSIMLPAFPDMQKNPRVYAESFSVQYRNTDPFCAKRLIEPYGEHEFIVQNPPQKPLSQKEMDHVYDLPYCRTFHPSYKKLGGIPAIAEIEFSLTSCRGCFGACSFCALTFHQGRIIQARSQESLVEEATNFTKEPDFKGTLDNVQYTVSPREAVNMIRTRVDMNAVETTGYDAFKKRLRNERRVELAFEGHRFWDIRRWMTGTSTTRIEGLSITAVKDESGEGYIYSYEKKTVQERIWEERMNYYPIQDVELFKNHNLVQNEGWESN